MKPANEIRIAPEEALLTVKQACERLQVGRTLLYGMCKAGLVRPVQVGTRGVRIPVSEVNRFVTEKLQT